MTDKKITRDTTVSTTEMAMILGLSARRVQQMLQDGTIEAISRGKINLGDGVQRYIRFIQKDAPSEDEAKTKQKKESAEAELKSYKAKLTQFEVEELEGKLHRSEDVQLLTEDMIYTIRSSLMSLPGRLAIDVINCKTAAEASVVITKEVHKIMTELANYDYDSEKYKELVRERREWDMEDKDEE